jgi:hypothetical protein
MVASGGNLQRPFGLRLAAKVGENWLIFRVDRGNRLRQRLALGKVGANVEQGAGGEYFVAADQRRFAGAGFGQDEMLAVAGRLQGHGQRAANRAQLAGQRQLAGKFVVGQMLAGNLPAGGEDTQRDGQVETAGFFWQIGRRQVNCDAFRRKLEPGINDGGANAIARFLDFSIWQADEGEAGQATGQMRLDRHRRRVEAIQSTTVRDGQCH